MSSSDISSLLNPSEDSSSFSNSSSQFMQSSDIRGRKIALDPIIPSSWKVCFVIGTLISLGLLITTILAVKGGLGLSTRGWEFKLIAGLTGTLGISQIISLVSMIFFFRLEKKLRSAAELEEKFRDSNESTQPQIIPIRPQSNHNQGPPPPPPALPQRNIDLNTWNDLLTSPQKNANGPPHFNLTDPNQELASNTEIGFPQLPILGRYEDNKVGGFNPDSVMMGARLPKQQLKAFPKELNAWFKDEPNVECYFLVFKNNDQVETSKRNLAMHMMALPEFDPRNPNSPKGKTKGQVFSSGNGIKTKMQISMFSPKGVKPGANINTRIPNGTSTGKYSEFTLHLHGKEIPKLSPDVASIEIERNNDVSSAYFGTKFRGKAVAIHAVFLNDENGTEGAKLVQAMNQNTPGDFLDDLQQSNFNDIDSILQTFTHPDDL